MKARLVLGLALATALGAASAALLPAAAQPVQKDWTRIVALTPEGGYRVGNPDAPVKLVEYGSLTCDHCANFAAQGVPRLLDAYVKGGRISFEFRNFVRDPYDLTAAMLSRCAGPGDYFALTDHYFASQPEWIGRFHKMTEAERKELESLADADRLKRLAAIGGLVDDAAKAGVANPSQCLADGAAIGQLAEIRRVAVEEHGLQGTPTFLLNGRRLDGVHNWPALEPLLAPPGS